MLLISPVHTQEKPHTLQTQMRGAGGAGEESKGEEEQEEEKGVGRGEEKVIIIIRTQVWLPEPILMLCMA